MRKTAQDPAAVLITVLIRRDIRTRSFKEVVDNIDDGLVTVHPSYKG